MSKNSTEVFMGMMSEGNIEAARAYKNQVEERGETLKLDEYKVTLRVDINHELSQVIQAAKVAFGEDEMFSIGLEIEDGGILCISAEPVEREFDDA